MGETDSYNEYQFLSECLQEEYKTSMLNNMSVKFVTVTDAGCTGN